MIGSDDHPGSLGFFCIFDQFRVRGIIPLRRLDDGELDPFDFNSSQSTIA